MEYKDFCTLSVYDLIELSEITKLVVNGCIFSPNTRVSELNTDELQILFGENSLEDIIEKYEYERLGVIKCDIRQRLKRYACDNNCVMYINKAYIILHTYTGLQGIKRENFNSAVKAIARNEV